MFHTGNHLHTCTYMLQGRIQWYGEASWPPWTVGQPIPAEAVKSGAKWRAEENPSPRRLDCCLKTNPSVNRPTNSVEREIRRCTICIQFMGSQISVTDRPNGGRRAFRDSNSAPTTVDCSLNADNSMNRPTNSVKRETVGDPSVFLFMGRHHSCQHPPK